MILLPTSLVGRLVAVGFLLGLLGSLWQFVIAPVIDAFRSQQQILEVSRNLLDKYQAQALSFAALQARIDELHEQQGTEAGFLDATNMAMGSAVLQTTSKRIIEANGGVLRSIQVLPSTPDGNANRAIVRIDGGLPGQRLVDFLYDLRSLIPYVFIENLDIRAPETANKAGPPDTDLTIRIDIYGYIRMAAK